MGSLEEIAKMTNTSVDFVEDVLTGIVQEFDPIGVGARDIRECLLLQIRQSEAKGTIVEKIVDKYLNLIEKNALPELAKKLNVSIEEVKEALETIKKFEPKPGRQYSSQTPQYIIPDLYVYKENGRWVIKLNDEEIPKLRINNIYKKILKQRKRNDPTKKFVREKFKSAINLIRSIEQRQKTIYQVMESILKHQIDFFEKGIKYLKPLTLRTIAEDIGKHESTVSRVCNNKYVDTPHGLFELKFFFSSSVSTDSGEELSSVKIKEMIKDIIKNEDPKKPLSDSKITEILKSRGIKIARRTVTKYREELKILPSNKRKKY